MDVSVFDGCAVKALGNGKVGGLLVRFSTENDPDLAGEFFTKDTDFDFEDGDKTSILYHHGLDPQIRGRSIGKGTLSHTEEGIWIEGQLNLRDEYERYVYDLAEKGKLGWSSGTASHRIEREDTGKATWIKSWALGIDASLTPTPCEPRTLAIPLKSLVEAPGSTLDAHTATLLDDLGTYLERIEDYEKLKTADGRKISKMRLDSLVELKTRLDEVIRRGTPGPDPRIAEMKLQLMKEKLEKLKRP